MKEKVYFMYTNRKVCDEIVLHKVKKSYGNKITCFYFSLGIKKHNFTPFGKNKKVFNYASTLL